MVFRANGEQLRVDGSDRRLPDHTVDLQKQITALADGIAQMGVLLATLTKSVDDKICALRRRYTIRFARTEHADCPVHGSIVTCDMSLECPGHVKIG